MGRRCYLLDDQNTTVAVPLSHGPVNRPRPRLAAMTGTSLTGALVTAPRVEAGQLSRAQDVQRKCKAAAVIGNKGNCQLSSYPLVLRKFLFLQFNLLSKHLESQEISSALYLSKVSTMRQRNFRFRCYFLRQPLPLRCHGSR